jgi:two-component sensor histidine kinase
MILKSFKYFLGLIYLSFFLLIFSPKLRGFQGGTKNIDSDSVDINEEKNYNFERRRIYFDGDLPWAKTKEGYQLLAEGSMEQAKRFADSCLQNALMSKSFADKMDAYALVSAFYEKKQDFGRSLFFKKKELLIRDTLLSLNNFESIQRLRQEFDLERKDAQIEKQKETIAQQTKIWRGLIAVTLLMAVGILFLLYFARQSRKSKERNALLLKELNHRVKNNLQTVSSIMRLQARQVKDPMVKEVLQESQARLDALSLIHQQLYRTDDVEKINLEKFIHDLIDKLLLTHDLMDKPFERNISIEKTPLNVDVALPMGLIINELLTNSFKYAYPSVSDAKLTIQLQNKKFHYADNGEGLPKNFAPEKTPTFGTQLIMSLSKQLRAKLKFYNLDGANCDITLP